MRAKMHLGLRVVVVVVVKTVGALINFSYSNFNLKSVYHCSNCAQTRTKPFSYALRRDANATKRGTNSSVLRMCIAKKINYVQ